MSSKPKDGRSGLPDTHKITGKVSSSPSPRLTTSISRRLSDPKPKDPSLHSPSSTPTLKPKLSSRSPASTNKLDLLQDELKKANDRVSLLEIEKGKALEELKEARKAVDGANEKLRDALAAQKRAEEDSEIEKFRAVEMEQAGIDAAQRKEEEWRREIEAVRNQHAVDVAALLSTTRELQRVQQELALAMDEKGLALSCADDAAKVAEIHAGKNEVLCAEILRIKGLLDSKLEDEDSEKSRMLLQLEDEVAALVRELERAKGVEDKLMERDASIERLGVDLEAAKLAESYAQNLIEEWKSKAEQLQGSLEVANKSERSALESLESVVKQLKRSNSQLNEAELEISALKAKVSSLEMAVEEQLRELQEERSRLTEVEEDYKDMEKAADSLRSDLDALKEEQARALSNERVASSSVQGLLEEKMRLVDELKISKEEEEKSKKAMESLASALHEVSAEARDAKEKLVCLQIEHENWDAQVEDLRLVLKSTKEKYEAMLRDDKGEIDRLAADVVQSSYECEASKAEWEQKELHLLDCLKQSEQEKHDLQIAKEGLDILLRQAEEKAEDGEEREALLKESLKEVEDEVVYLQEALGEAKAEGVKLERSILDKEHKLQGLVRDNDELRVREAASNKRMEELSKLLEEATLKTQPSAENGNLSDSEGELDLLPKTAEFSQENGHSGEAEEELLETGALVQPEDPKEDSLLDTDEKQQQDQGGSAKVGNVNGEAKEEDCLAEKEEDSGGVEAKMATEADSKENGTDTSENGVNSFVSEDSNSKEKKKKKALLGKFGSLLRKKGVSSPSPSPKKS